jgi:hypothetical protein
MATCGFTRPRSFTELIGSLGAIDRFTGQVIDKQVEVVNE